MNDTNKMETVKLSHLSFKYGVIGGLVTSLLLILLSKSGEANPLYYSLFKYIPMGVMVFLALNILQKIVEKKSVFGKGAKIAFNLSLIAGLIVAVTSFILYAINPDWAFDKFGKVTNSFPQAATVAAMLFFEILVVTNLIAFVILQYIKRNVKI